MYRRAWSQWDPDIQALALTPFTWQGEGPSGERQGQNWGVHRTGLWCPWLLPSLFPLEPQKTGIEVTNGETEVISQCGPAGLVQEPQYRSFSTTQPHASLLCFPLPLIQCPHSHKDLGAITLMVTILALTYFEHLG